MNGARSLRTSNARIVRIWLYLRRIFCGVALPRHCRPELDLMIETPFFALIPEKNPSLLRGLRSIPSLIGVIFGP